MNVINCVDFTVVFQGPGPGPGPMAMCEYSISVNSDINFARIETYWMVQVYFDEKYRMALCHIHAQPLHGCKSKQ